MSYCRFGWGGSDVYVFVSSSAIECCGCALQEREWQDNPDSFLGGYLHAIGEIIPTAFTKTADMVEHLKRHIAAGHCVPDDVIPSLLADAEENDRYLATGMWSDHG